MSKPIYKLYLMNVKEAGYQLSEAEREELMAKMNASFDAVGGEQIIGCDCIWSSEPWLSFGVQKYPDIEAAQKHAADLAELGWYRYVDAMTVLGTEVEG